MAKQERPANFAVGYGGVSTTDRTTYPEADLGATAISNYGHPVRYGYAAAAVPAGTCGLTFTPAVVAAADVFDTYDKAIKIVRKGDVTTPATCAIASGSGYVAESPFAAKEYGWVVGSTPTV